MCHVMNVSWAFRNRPASRREAEMAVFEYINGFYNPRRRHSTLGWKSPVAFERKVRLNEHLERHESGTGPWLRIDDVVELNVKARGDLPMLHAYYDNLKANYVPRDAAVNYAHAARQAYISLGIALVAAAEQEVDSTPMEGFARKR
jgi:hypothetical protein